MSIYKREEIYREITVKSAICVALRHGPNGADVTICEKDADKPMAPASTVKLITALVAVRVANRLHLPRSFRLEVAAEDQVVGSGRNIHPGDRISFNDSIANLLVPSSNVTANMIARIFGRLLLGSARARAHDAVTRFVIEMNTMARSLGMSHSVFLNPHGLAAVGQKSTARELAMLTKACLAHEQITRVWRTRAFAIGVTGPTPRRLVAKSAFHVSTGRAVGEFSLPHYLGGKTGTLAPSHYNLASVSGVDHEKTCISVILGAPTAQDRYFDYLRLAQLGHTMMSRAA